jgi:peptide/nickel transport system permease protein
MLSESRQYLMLSPHVVLIPGAAILLIVVALSPLGDALRDALDVRLKES